MLIYLQVIDTAEERSKFEAIYHAYRNLMFHVAYQKLGHEQDAEDVVHHVFMKIAENIKKIEPVCPKTRQLVVIMVEHRVTDLFRARGRHPEAEYCDALHDSPAEAAGEESLLMDCIMKLPEQQRMVVWLKYHYGYTLREIANMLDLSLPAAQKLDQRAKKKLEELYTQGGGML